MLFLAGVTGDAAPARNLGALLTHGDAEQVVVTAGAPATRGDAEQVCVLTGAPVGARGAPAASGVPGAGVAGGAAPAELLTRASKAVKSAARSGKQAILAW